MARAIKVDWIKGHQNDNEFSTTPSGLNDEDERMKSTRRARHESINKRLKQLGILESVCGLTDNVAPCY